MFEKFHAISPAVSRDVANFTIFFHTKICFMSFVSETFLKLSLMTLMETAATRKAVECTNHIERQISMNFLHFFPYVLQRFCSDPKKFHFRF